MKLASLTFDFNDTFPRIRAKDPKTAYWTIDYPPFQPEGFLLGQIQFLKHIFAWRTKPMIIFEIILHHDNFFQGEVPPGCIGR